MSKLAHLLQAAYRAALFQLRRLAMPEPDVRRLTFTIDLNADGYRPNVSISGPCEMFGRVERYGVADIVDMAKRAQRALLQPIVDEQAGAQTVTHGLVAGDENKV
jgi:hypothetical protein